MLVFLLIKQYFVNNYESCFLLNDAGLYGANLSLSNMIKSYGFKDCLVLSPSEGPFLSLLKEMGVSYKVVPFKFNMATYNKNF